MSNTDSPYPESRYFSPGPTLGAALEIYRQIADLPILCPHGHVDPRLFSGAAGFGSPTDLLIRPDHYVFRMLYSHGISLEALGIAALQQGERLVETDHRKIWQLFADNFHLFRGTPSGMWLTHELRVVLGIEQILTSENAQVIYEQIETRLQSPELEPRRAFERLNIEVLCTTDSATDSLEHHQAIRKSGWTGKVIPTFRPDAVVNLDTPGWRQNIEALSQVSGVDVVDYPSFLRALECRRQFFRENGAVSTDHAVLHLDTTSLGSAEAEAVFQSALADQATPADSVRFSAHMLTEMARMSLDDGLVMQIHPGSLRNHNTGLFEQFGGDKGADIPVQAEFTRALRPLLSRYGNEPRLQIILFTMDESTYSRELATLAGHYPCLKLGPPWWFHDSWNGMRRYFDQVMETTGLYNTCGFNDDTRAFLSIPARHDLWRRASADWLAGLLTRHVISENEAYEMAWELAYGLVKKAYNL